jgi:hypothetical protein
MSRSLTVCIAGAALLHFAAARGQDGAPAGYFDIPAGYDFPADKHTLERYRAEADVAKQRLHVWNVFAGMTQPTPDGKLAIWETWYSEEETFQSGLSAQAAAGPRLPARRFRQPSQFRAPPGAIGAQAAGTAVLSFVLYNHAGHDHIRANRLFSTAALEQLRTAGAADPKVPDNRIVKPFPSDAIAMKTVWWPVAKNGITPLPIWDPEKNAPNPRGNPFTSWARAVAVDTTRAHITPNETRTVSFAGRSFPGSRVVGLESFHYVTLDKQTVEAAMRHQELASAVQLALGRPLRPGDYAVFLGTHLTTKEIDDWVWATFWWHDRPQEGPFSADRPPAVKGVWRNYLMSASYDVNLPRERDNTPHVTFNPWLEAGFQHGVESNCMNCHQRASYPSLDFRPIRRGDPDLEHDPAFAKGRLRTDLLWSIPFMAQ